VSALALRPDAAPAGERWTLDLDIGERAALARPRKIRETIAEMVIEGKLNDFDCVPLGALRTGPLFRLQNTTVPRGNQGGTQDVTEYLLNDDAALLVLLRLRTPEALAATVELVNGIRDRATAMLAAAREEGRREALGLSAADVRAIVRDELGAAQKPKALPVRSPAAWLGYGPALCIWLGMSAPDATWTTVELLREACGVTEPSRADQMMAARTLRAAGYRRIRAKFDGIRAWVYQR
jgi:hypothetical protein